VNVIFQIIHPSMHTKKKSLLCERSFVRHMMAPLLLLAAAAASAAAAFTTVVFI
jgi:hypothetical protein